MKLTIIAMTLVLLVGCEERVIEQPLPSTPIPLLTMRLDQMNDSVFVVQIFNDEGIMTDCFFHRVGFRHFVPIGKLQRFKDAHFVMEEYEYKPYEIPITRDSSIIGEHK